MANSGNGSSGAAGGHQQSIGTETDQPVDGIAGSHPGTQEPSGQHVNAGGVGTGPGQRHEPQVGLSQQGGGSGSMQKGMGSDKDRIDDAAHAGAREGTLGRGGIKQDGAIGDGRPTAAPPDSKKPPDTLAGSK